MRPIGHAAIFRLLQSDAAFTIRVYLYVYIYIVYVCYTLCRVIACYSFVPVRYNIIYTAVYRIIICAYIVIVMIWFFYYYSVVRRIHNIII